MKLLEILERLLRPVAIPNLTVVILIGQVLTYLLMLAEPDLVVRMALIPILVLEGEVWRIFTFVFIPPVRNPIFAAFAWYLFYLMGTALERNWGNVRFNLYLLIGYLATVIASFAAPFAPASHLFLGGSVFLAFAFLNPKFELMLFLVLPVQVRWLALFTWSLYLGRFLFGTASERLMVAASAANFLVFFGPELLRRVRSRGRVAAARAEERELAGRPRHRCTVCGVTNLTDPDMDFRYCSKCEGEYAYCRDHIYNHEHIQAEKP